MLHETPKDATPQGPYTEWWYSPQVLVAPGVLDFPEEENRGLSTQARNSGLCLQTHFPLSGA